MTPHAQMWYVRFPVRTIRDMPAYKFWRSPDVVGFVEKIAANPEDDLPRLVFCDWLEDTAGGEVDIEHADFIRRSLHLSKSQYGVTEIPPRPSIRERVYAGYSPFEHPQFAAQLCPPFLVAGVDRGFLSRVTYTARVYRNLGGFVVHVRDRIAALHGPLATTLRPHSPFDDKPIAMFHPYWFVLDDPGALDLDTFRGSRTNMGGPAVHVGYLGNTYRYELSALQEMEAVKPGTCGPYVIRDVLSRYWEDEFERINFPVRVIPSAAVVEHVNKGISPVQPL